MTKRKSRDGAIVELARKLIVLQERARRVGMFVADRELLTCPGCGLSEDVSAYGMLMTSYSSNLGTDTGLRFEEMSRKMHRYRCPSCGIGFIAPAKGPGERSFPTRKKRLSRPRKR